MVPALSATSTRTQPVRANAFENHATAPAPFKGQLDAAADGAIGLVLA